VQFQRQLGLTRYETAFGILHKLRARRHRTGPGRARPSPAHQRLDPAEIDFLLRGRRVELNAVASDVFV
jgi:hypothetical protein